ncbi:MAG: hypothetical protein R3D30_10060 [Hyphomicrobiales bacterium]
MSTTPPARFSTALSRRNAVAPNTDVRTPEMTGIELLTRVKERAPLLAGHRHHWPWRCATLAVEAMKAGAIDFIEKPFDEAAILEAVNAALQQTDEEAETAADQAEIRSRSLSERERQVLEGLLSRAS